MSTKICFCILRANGQLKGRRSGEAAGLYSTAAKAQNHARDNGDSVVAVVIDLDVEPLFIRRKVLNGDS